MAANGGQIVVDFTIDDGKAVVAVKRAGQTLSELKRTLDKTSDSVARLERHNDSLGRKFRDIVLTLGNLRFVAMDVNDIFLRLPMTILRTAGELEKLQVLMKGLSKETTEVGKVAEAAKSFQFVVDAARAVPFEIKAIADTFVKLKVAGIDPTAGAAQTLFDSVAKFGGTGETLKRASIAIQQMAGKGVISMEELRQQLGEAVPTAMQSMADGMGVSMAKLAKIVESGTLQAGPALDKMFLMMRVGNRGAAREMMNTWGGMTERLKTELALQAQAIANSGFGDAAKAAVGDIIGMLNTADFRRFSMAAGAELGEAVKAIAGFVKTLVEYRKEIGLVIGAWLGFKVVSSVVEVMDKLRTRMVASYRETAAAATASATSKHQAALNEATSARNTAVAQQAASADWIAALSRQVIANDRAVDAIIAKRRVLDAAMAASRNGEVRVPAMSGVPGVAGLQSTATVTKAQKELTDQLTRQQAAAQRTRDQLNALALAHRGLDAGVATTTAKMREMERATGAATAAQRAMAAGASMMRGAFALIGGWIGAVTIALMAGVYAWNRWANAAEEAANRKLRADRKLSTEEDVKRTQEDLEKARTELERLNGVKPGQFSETAGGAATGSRTKATLKDIENHTRAVQEAERKVAALEDTAAKQRKSRLEEGARDIADGIDKQGREKVEAIERARDAEVAGLDKQLAEITGSTEKDIAARKVLNDKRIAADMTAQRAIIANRQANYDALTKTIDGGIGTDAEIEAARIQRQRLGKEMEGQRRELAEMQRQIDATVVFKAPKDDKGGKAAPEKIHTPLESLLNKLRADRAELNTELATVMSDLARVDKAKAAADKVLERGKADASGNTGFDYKLGKKVMKPDAKQVTEAADLAAGNVRMEEAVALAKKIAEQGRSIEGDYQRAVQMIADPLSLVPSRGKAGDFDDMLAKSGMGVREIGAAAGLSGDKLELFVSRVASVREQLRTIDVSEQIKAVAETTRDLGEESARINAELIADDSERAIALAALDDDVLKKRIANDILRLKSHAGTAKEIEALEAALATNLAARSARLAEDMKSPMQRLVDQWKKDTDAMKAATADWAQQGVDAFVNFARTGKFEWKSLVEDILAGLLKIQIQKQLAAAIETGSGKDGWITKIGTLAAGFFGGASAPTTGVSVTGASAASTFNASSIASKSYFADGGIMSSLGSLPLKKYAKGGVANSPQMAIFGEGDMNEAYVPLPDGRSIPVSLKGKVETGGGSVPSVTVNVINQSGQAVQAQQSAPRMDGKQMVLDVVLSAASTPGPFRDNLMNAVGR